MMERTILGILINLKALDHIQHLKMHILNHCFPHLPLLSFHLANIAQRHSSTQSIYSTSLTSLYFRIVSRNTLTPIQPILKLYSVSYRLCLVSSVEYWFGLSLSFRREVYGM